MKRRFGPLCFVLLAMGAALAACQDTISEKPPIHFNPNMDDQARYDLQEHSAFFADGRAMRPQVLGTVARGELREDDHLYRGKVNGEWAPALPPGMELTEAFLARGKQRFGIYCAPCHDAAGSGKGIVVQRGMLPPPNFSDPRLLAMPIGQIYDVIANGVRLMPAYGPQITVEDRWAAAVYVRALQISRTASAADLPAGALTPGVAN